MPPIATPFAQLEWCHVYEIFWIAGELLESSSNPELCPIARKSLDVFALVCKEWREYIHNVTAELNLRDGILTNDSLSSIPNREFFVDIRHFIATLRGPLRYLKVDLNLPNTDLYSHWRSVLCLVPRLKVLDLRGIPREKAQLLASIIRATRSCCPELYSLTVPSLDPPTSPQSYRFLEDPADAKLMLNAVFEPVVAQGNQYKSQLRVLNFSVQFSTQSPSDALATRYVNRLCDVYPDIELLEGWSTRYKDGQVLYSDLWYIDDVTWERFCATCCSLKRFNWLVAPYTTSCFEIFGRYPKPKLTLLEFGASATWSWFAYYNHIGQPMPPSGYGRMATNIHAALRACPNLEVLSVVVEGQIRKDLYVVKAVRPPTVPAMNQEMFGDAFCQEVARSCRHLTAMAIVSASVEESTCGTIMSLTDVGLAALASLPNLRELHLKPINVTGAGLFNLAVNFATNPEKTRRQLTAEILLGDEFGTPCDTLFYTVVADFLRLLSARGRSPVCVGKCVVLRLINTFVEVLNQNASGEYVAMVKKLALQATTLHTNIRLMLLVEEGSHGSDAFDSAVEFVFFTADADLSRWGWGSKAKTRPAHQFIVDLARLADFA